MPAVEETKVYTEHDGEHPQIVIDGKYYRAPRTTMTGDELRRLASPRIGPDWDLWLEVPGGEDKLIGEAEPVQLKDGLVFFSAPKHINPGRTLGFGRW